MTSSANELNRMGVSSSSLSSWSVAVLLVIVFVSSIRTTEAFSARHVQIRSFAATTKEGRRPVIFATNRNHNNNEEDAADKKKEKKHHHPEQPKDGSNKSQLLLMEGVHGQNEKIQVDKERVRLEDVNRKSFLKRKPWKLPYDDARKWIQANYGSSVNTEEDFIDLIENGYLRTPYIPKRPEEYYTHTREWISWEHFLTGMFDNKNPSSIRPYTGIFD